MPKVKICGNTNLEDAKLAVELGADYLGFIFAPSKRKIELEIVKSIIEKMPYFKSYVGVFLNQSKQEVKNILDQISIPILQFHGEETALYCDYFMEKGYEVIKTFRIKDTMSLKRLDEYSTNAFLFDTFSRDQAGGTGKTFDWSLLKSKPVIAEKLFLAGGLNVENLQQAIEIVHPFAVDVASGVESAPGKKDSNKLEQFIRIAKKGEKQNEQKSPLRS